MLHWEDKVDMVRPGLLNPTRPVRLVKPEPDPDGDPIVSPG